MPHTMHGHTQQIQQIQHVFGGGGRGRGRFGSKGIARSAPVTRTGSACPSCTPARAPLRGIKQQGLPFQTRRGQKDCFYIPSIRGEFCLRVMCPRNQYGPCLPLYPSDPRGRQRRTSAIQHHGSAAIFSGVAHHRQTRCTQLAGPLGKSIQGNPSSKTYRAKRQNPADLTAFDLHGRQESRHLGGSANSASHP